MQDVVDPFTGGAHRSGIAQVRLPEVDLVLKAGKVRCLSGQVVVHPADVLPAFYQGSRQGRSDEARDSRDQIFRHAVISQTLRVITRARSYVLGQPVKKAIPAPNEYRSSAHFLRHGLGGRWVVRNHL